VAKSALAQALCSASSLRLNNRSKRDCCVDKFHRSYREFAYDN